MRPRIASLTRTLLAAAGLGAAAEVRATLPELLREVHATISSMDSYAFEFEVQVITGESTEGVRTSGSVYKQGTHLRKELGDATYLHSPGLGLIVNRRDKTIACSRFEGRNHASLEAGIADLERWIAQSPSIDDLGDTVDGRGFAMVARGLGIARTEMYIDRALKLPTKIVYWYQVQTMGAPTGALVRYRWKEVGTVAPSLLDPAEYVSFEGGRCRAAGAYRTYRVLDEVPARD